MVKIGFLEDEPIIIAAVAAKISQTPFEKGSIEDLYEECRGKKLEEEVKRLERNGEKEKAKELEKEIKRRIANSREMVNAIIEKSGHLIFGEFLPYAVFMEGLSRFAALYLWRNVNAQNLVYGAGLEASFRVMRPNRYNTAVSELGKIAFEVYEKAVEQGVPEQDARYLLPEGTLTRMIFTAPPRHLLKLGNNLCDSPLIELKEIGSEINSIVSKEFGLKMPKEKPASEWNFWEYKSHPLKEEISLNYGRKEHSISLQMRIKGSLAMYAQLVRQRQILCDIESLARIVGKGVFVLPASFPESIKKEYQEIASIAIGKQMKLLMNKDPDFVYFLLLGQEAWADIYGRGFSVLETSKSRSEGVAQWEIRNKVGIPLTRKLLKHPSITGNNKEIGPRCYRERRCIEPATFKTKKNICKAFLRDQGIWKGSLPALLDTLEEKYTTFKA
ncbi:MAG: FAD-dependent thymidylate synthase [Candidatus Nealsonbacteria bacterium]|nr:FAD-dependent thymidylate synthase [Candidatus Nealsonbacteria bacterium]